MNKQLSLSLVDDELKSAKTNKKEFLEKIDSIMPWEKFEELVRPCYYKGQLGFRKTRYKGRRKQQAKLNMMFALANIIIADRRGYTAV